MPPVDHIPPGTLAVQTGLLTNTPTGDTTIFTYNGPVEILAIDGIVEGTAMANAATGILLKATNDALAATDICAVLDVDSATVGTALNITGTIADALVASAVGVKIAQAAPITLHCVASGKIELENAGAANAGQTRWAVAYRPLAPGARILAAV